MCRFNTSSCVRSTRLRVYRQHACCRYTRRRVERTHDDVLNLHTGFSVCHTPHTPHRPPHARQREKRKLKRCPGEPHERSPNAPKFEDRSQEETEWQEQVAREAAWKLAKNVFKLKEHQRGAFFSPSENGCLPASTLKPEEREFVVDSGASMHMISKKGVE